MTRLAKPEKKAGKGTTNGAECTPNIRARQLAQCLGGVPTKSAQRTCQSPGPLRDFVGCLACQDCGKLCE
jgi:hypothetical protein